MFKLVSPLTTCTLVSGLKNSIDKLFSSIFDHYINYCININAVRVHIEYTITYCIYIQNAFEMQPPTKWEY